MRQTAICRRREQQLESCFKVASTFPGAVLHGLRKVYVYHVVPSLREPTIQELFAHLPDGPWRWNGQYTSVHLCTDHSGQYYLMGVDRCGFSGAQFTFQTFSDPKMGYGRLGGSGILRGWQDNVYVGRTYYDPKQIRDISHPLAQLIKRIPEMVGRIADLETTLEKALEFLCWTTKNSLFFDRDPDSDTKELRNPPWGADCWDYNDDDNRELLQFLGAQGKARELGPGFWAVEGDGGLPVTEVIDLAVYKNRRSQ